MRKPLIELNTKNYQDAKKAQAVRTWKARGGTFVLRQRPSGKWEAEYTSNDDEEYIVALASTPAKAIKRIRRNATALAA